MRKTAVVFLLLFSGTLAHAGYDFSERTEKTLPLGANGRVTLHSSVGEIRIHASDRKDVKVVATKRAKNVSDAEGATRAAKVRLDFATSANDVRITADWQSKNTITSRDKADVQVDFDVEVPRSARLDVTENVGDVTIDGAASDVAVHNNVGTVKVGFAGGFKPRLVHLETNVGDIDTNFKGHVEGFIGKKFATILDGDHSVEVYVNVGDVKVRN